MSLEGRKHQLDTFSSRRSLRADVVCGGPTTWTAAPPSRAVIADGASTDEPMTASGPGGCAHIDDADGGSRCRTAVRKCSIHAPWSFTAGVDSQFKLAPASGNTLLAEEWLCRASLLFLPEQEPVRDDSEKAF